MTVLNLQVSSNADDGCSQYGFWNSNIPLQVGDLFGSNSGFNVRFTGNTMAQGATVNSALLTVRGYSDSGIGAVAAKYRGELALNPSQITDQSSFDARTRTTAQVNQSIPQTTGDEDIVLSDISTVIQEIVDQSGFNSGVIQLFVENNSATDFCNFYGYNQSSTYAPKLDITYTPGAAPAPTVTSVAASSGSTAGGTNVTITGTGFVATPTVTFGGTSATNVVWVNSTTLTCTTPAHAAGAVNVVVTNPDTQTGTGTNAFTYVAPSTAGPPLVAGCPKVDLSIRSFTVGQPGGFF